MPDELTGRLDLVGGAPKLAEIEAYYILKKQDEDAERAAAEANKEEGTGSSTFNK